MPTDGLVRKKPSAARTTRKKAAPPAPAPPSHRTIDLAGASLAGIGLILLAVMAAGNGGFLGNGIAGGLRYLVGGGAWVVAILSCFAGSCLLLGRGTEKYQRVAWGASLTFLGALAIFAASRSGDYFDPEVMSASGGAIGALVAWALERLLGVGKPVAILLMIASGVILCLEMPVREALPLAWRLIMRKPKLVQPEIMEPEEEPIRPQRRNREATEAKAVVEAQVAPTRPAFIDRLLQREPSLEEDDTTPLRSDAPAAPKAKREVKVVSQGEPVFESQLPKSSGSYQLPPLSLLAEPPARSKKNPQDLQKNIEILEGTLDQFGVDANVVEVATGPSLTRYEIQLGPGIRVNKIVQLADNIAMSLAAHHVRVEAPIPGKAAIGVEVPNPQRTLVTLREMCDSLEFHDNSSRLQVALGKDVAGVAKYADLSKMPHLLIGGATNSGKSIGLASIIMSLIVRHAPKEVRLVMIDPKRVELSLFEGLPHLMCPVVKDVKEAAGVLRAVWREMDKRYDMFSEKQVRNIDGWNSKADPDEKLPYIVVIIDELADLMIQCRAEVETSICRLAQLARATGIHLVIATQRPSVDVITGTIKANIASRIAFAVSSQVDSRTILDSVGADKLLGRGDMLFHPIDSLKPVRVQGCYVSEKEIEDVCVFWRRQEKPFYVLNPIQIAVEEREASMREEEEADPLWEECVRFVVERGQASTSMIQRKFSIGFQRASRLLDLMEERGVVGPRDGPRPREVLVDAMQMEAIFGKKEYLSPMDPSEFIDED
jgi:S-DNA-T family DNA segregation ATPase FtsK/SpoIIIE